MVGLNLGPTNGAETETEAQEVKPEVQDVEPDIVLTLNGGKKEMDSATIPVQWWLSEEVIEQNPQHIIFFEQNESEKNDIHTNNHDGRRYACRVEDAVKYLQMLSPGYHRLMVVVVGGSSNDNALEEVENLLNDEHYSCKDYTYSLSWSDVERGKKPREDAQIIAATIEEFEVPEELFAKKPETKRGKAMWWWANFFFNKNPRDECAYRKRKIVAFTIQPFLATIVFFIAFGIGGTIFALYVLLASLALLFVGYRPRPILREMWRAFTFQREPEWDVRKFDQWDTHGPVYRLWSISEDGKEIYMPITPLVVTIYTSGIAMILAGLYYLLRSASVDFWLIILITAVALTAATFAFRLIAKCLSAVYAKSKERRRIERQLTEDVEAIQRTNEQEARRQWLIENFELSKQTDVVRLDQLPVPPTFSGKVAQKFRVSYWALKAKVCKPFAK